MATRTLLPSLLPLRSSLACRRLITRSYSVDTGSERVINTEDITAPHVGHIKVLRLNRPSARNAISKQLLLELQAEISGLKCAPNQTRVLVITSAVKGVFCAGADLKERKTFTLDETRQFLSSLRATFAQIASLPIPTIAAVNGHALGGGLELALCTTFRVAASTAKLGLPETRLGIIPGAGGTYRLPAIVGRQLARNMILRGQSMPGIEARTVGLVDECCDIAGSDDAESAVMALALGVAKQICSGGPIAALQALRAIEGWGQGEKAENDAYEKVLGTQDRLAALKAFAEKKTPQFTGT